MVFAFPKASRRVPACVKRSLTEAEPALPSPAKTTHCREIRAASVFPEPLSP